jgi:hypothetical protein
MWIHDILTQVYAQYEKQKVAEEAERKKKEEAEGDVLLDEICGIVTTGTVQELEAALSNMSPLLAARMTKLTESRFYSHRVEYMKNDVGDRLISALAKRDDPACVTEFLGFFKEKLCVQAWGPNVPLQYRGFLVSHLIKVSPTTYNGKYPIEFTVTQGAGSKKTDRTLSGRGELFFFLVHKGYWWCLYDLRQCGHVPETTLKLTESFVYEPQKKKRVFYTLEEFARARDAWDKLKAVVLDGEMPL